ncbi:MAG: GGDEF domain-containing protein [Planctomycetota bacterium]
MNLTLILPWFPIVLAVGVGSHLLDRARGLGFGVLGALLWVVVVQAASGTAVYTQFWHVVSLVSGAAAIIAVGAWAGQRAQGSKLAVAASEPKSDRSSLATERASVVGVLRRFDDWLEAHRHTADPWPEFGEFVRWVLHELCGATHVRPYRVLSEGDQLVPLRAIESGDSPDVASARHGIVGHVATSGVSYIAGDPSHGALVDHLAEGSGGDLAWCFAIKRGGRKIGVVKVGQLGSDGHGDPSAAGVLALVESLVGLFWTTLGEVCRSRAAEKRDPTSGLLTREAFLGEANRVLEEAYAQQEPVAVAVIALEGTRALADRSEWELADTLVAEAAHLLLERVRADDRVGRFDDSRFVLLLRRVDSALGSLIVDQLWSALTRLYEDGSRCCGEITVRCGVAGSGNDEPALAQLVSRAIAECHEARRRTVPISSDLEPAPACALTGESGTTGRPVEPVATPIAGSGPAAEQVER